MHSLLREKGTRFSDQIHGTFYVSELATLFIDNPFIQRLKYVKQLACADFVSHTAHHTRFDHSLGVYFLAKKFFNELIAKMTIKEKEEYLLENEFIKLVIQSTKEGKISEYFKNFDEIRIIEELIGIGGLSHDIGHGPYAHVYDAFVKNSCHEQRSCAIVEKMFNEHKFPKEVILFIKAVIMPSVYKPAGECFVFQIVCNEINSVDVDKFDYIERDRINTGTKSIFEYTNLINSAFVFENAITYPVSDKEDIKNLFLMRYKMHKNIYNSPKVAGVAQMLGSFFQENSNVFEQYNDDLDLFVKLNDVSVEALANDKILIEREVFERIRERDVWRCCKVHKDGSFTKLNYESYIIKVKLGFICDNKKDPLKNMVLFHKGGIQKAEATKQKIRNESFWNKTATYVVYKVPYSN